MVRSTNVIPKVIPEITTRKARLPESFASHHDPISAAIAKNEILYTIIFIFSEYKVNEKINTRRKTAVAIANI